MTKETMKEMLREAWKSVFEVDDANDDADFFEDGGDSIKAVQLSAWLLQKGIKLDLGVIFSAPLLSQMAETLQETDPVYIPDKLLTKDMVQQKYSEVMKGNYNNPKADIPSEGTGDSDQQICDPANNQQMFSQMQQGEDQQICDPANNQQMFTQMRQGEDQQICDPANNQQMFTQMRQGEDQQICDPAKNQQMYSDAPQFGGMNVFASDNTMLQMVQIMISQQQTMLQMMNMMISMISQQQRGSAYPSVFASNYSGSSMPKTPKEADSRFSDQKKTEIQNWINQYQSRKIEKPVEKPNIIGLDKAKVGKPEKSAAEVLEYVLSTVLKNGLDKKVDLFEQGLSSLDTVKMVTRCGEYGYKLNMQDIYMHSMFDELVNFMTPGE